MRIRVGPFLLVLCAAVYRALWLSWQITGGASIDVAYLLLADVPVLGLLGITAWVEAALARPWRLVARCVGAIVFVCYAADLVTVLSLNARLQLSDLAQFGPEIWLVGSYITAAAVAIAIGVGSVFVTATLPGVVVQSIPASGLVLVILPFILPEAAIPSHLQKYTGSVLLLAKEAWNGRPQPISQYRPGDIAAYSRDYGAIFDVPFARSGKDIVLVITESLSAADSDRTSTVRDLLDGFDALSRKGMLFRNFFANYEASEGGIVALLSGVPPMHFPTASTDTFLEYSRLRALPGVFAKNGYHTEFLTTVPLQFISMDKYTHSQLVGFHVAEGQHEIPRMAGAERFAFESPTDHVLYEELLSRLDARATTPRQPVFMVLVTASSHTPFVDPLHRFNGESNVWSYVQNEMTWLYNELDRRGYFNNGLLIITGDHRRMTPLRSAERQRYGETAKARIPLLMIGAGVPADRVDDRLFQQSDLLRMLDRALQPGVSLSPYILWVERYSVVMGIASNAANVEVFDATPQGQKGFRLRLHGADLEWIDRPEAAFSIERAIHGQRALQQATRAAVVAPTRLEFGRELTPAEDRQGAVVGLSSDTNLSRNPDDQAGSLITLPTSSFELNRVFERTGRRTTPFTLSARAFVSIPRDGEYWFSVFADDAMCLAIDKQIVLGCVTGANEGVAYLKAGLHRLDVRYIQRGGEAQLDLRWMPPGSRQFVSFPQENLRLPDGFF